MYTQCWSTISQKNGIFQLHNFKSLKIHRLYFDVDCQKACVKMSQDLIMRIPMSKEIPVSLSFFFFLTIWYSQRENCITAISQNCGCTEKSTYLNIMWKMDKYLICSVFEGYVCWSKEMCQLRSLVSVLTRLYTVLPERWSSFPIWLGISLWMLYSDQLSDPPSFLPCRRSWGMYTVQVGAKV
jgi:hypothetical protein